MEITVLNVIIMHPIEIKNKESYHKKEDLYKLPKKIALK